MTATKTTRSPRITAMDGLIVYRSRPMRYARAERFAHLIENNRRFSGASVEKCRKGGQFFVAYLPASQGRRDVMFETVQEAQVQRALIQRDGYCYELRADGSCTIESPRGDSYEVDAQGGCDCPQARYRLKGTGIACKHAVMVALLIAERS